MGSRIHQLPRTGARGSALVMAAFGAVWWLSGAMALGGAEQMPVAGIGLMLAVVLLGLSARRLSGDGEQDAYARAAGRFRTTNLIQAGAIAAVIVLGNATHEQGWIPGSIAVIVGLHFLPLAKPFGRPEYRWVGGVMALLGVVGCGLAWTGTPVGRVLSVVGLGTAGVLWASVVFWLLSAARPTVS